ncbi:hypothetical protein [Nafulsella turpanensis]|uniref:hypothetical protein n=1 Tax=Nafulsella turpanensis TaxID=1265690 RepID=UPI000348DB83|nr:hypothetical protein [Nafulsella turpanensis]
MEDLLKLIDITKKRGQRSIQLVNQNFRKKEISKDNLLYEGIINGKFDSDSQAAKIMFKSKPGNRNYRNAKGKLKQKLLNHLYFLDYDKSSYTLFEKCEYECLHSLHQCKILIREGANDVAIKLLPQLLKNAKQYECVDIVVEALTILRNEYARLGKATPFDETQEELSYYRSFKEAIDASETDFHQILVYINKSVSAQNRVLSKIPDTVAVLKERAEKFKSRQIDRLVFQLQSLYNELSWNFEENIRLCSSIEEKYLRKNISEIEINLSKKEVALTKLKSYYCLKDAEQGGIYAQKVIKLFKPGTGSWFRFMEIYFLLLMKGEGYKKAGDIFRKVRTNKNYSLLPESEKDKWQIYRAFLVFVNDSKLLRWGFNLEEFVAELPDFPKEQAPYNTATLIIQYIYLLKEGNIEEVRRREEALQQYNSTHLDKRHNYRNSIFIRLLSIVTEKDFNYELIEEKGKNYFNKLENAHIPSDPETDMEIIPYEKLYCYILEFLKTNKIYVHYRFYNLNAV